MSTHARIIVKLPNDCNTIKLDPKALPYPVVRDMGNEELMTFVSNSNNKGVPPVVKIEPEIHEIERTGNYVSIYVHMDGDVPSVGRELKAHYNSIESALNLIALGVCDTIIGYSKIHYIRPWTAMGAAWKSDDKYTPTCAPFFADNIEDFACEHYNYYFDGTNWYWKMWNWRKWRLLK